MERHPLGDLMEATMGKLREMVKTDTIVGDPIHTLDGTTLIPVSKVSFGFASGGTDLGGKTAAPKDTFSGASGAGVKVTPMAFVVIKDNNVRIMTIEPPVSNTLDRVVESAPDLIDKVQTFIKKDKEEQ